MDHPQRRGAEIAGRDDCGAVFAAHVIFPAHAVFITRFNGDRLLLLVIDVAQTAEAAQGYELFITDICGHDNAQLAQLRRRRSKAAITGISKGCDETGGLAIDADF